MDFDGAVIEEAIVEEVVVVADGRDPAHGEDDVFGDGRVVLGVGGMAAEGVVGVGFEDADGVWNAVELVGGFVISCRICSMGLLTQHRGMLRHWDNRNLSPVETFDLPTHRMCQSTASQIAEGPIRRNERVPLGELARR